MSIYTIVFACLTSLMFVGCQKATEVAEWRVSSMTRSADLEERTFVKDDTTVRYWVGGRGEETVMLVHGFGASGLWGWASQIKEIAKHYRIIVPDLLWFGGSFSGQEPSLDLQAETLLHLLDHEGVADAKLVGVSYGGFVSMTMTLQSPDQIEQVVLIDSPGPEFGAAGITQFCQRFGVESPVDIFVPTDPAGIQVLMDLAFHRALPRLPAAALTDIHTEVFSMNQPQQRQLIEELQVMGAQQTPDLSVWDTDALVIWGEYDPVFPVEAGRQLAGQINAPLLVIPNTAHTPNQEKPKLVNGEILRFFAGQPTALEGELQVSDEDDTTQPIGGKLQQE